MDFIITNAFSEAKLPGFILLWAPQEEYDAYLAQGVYEAKQINATYEAAVAVHVAVVAALEEGEASPIAPVTPIAPTPLLHNEYANLKVREVLHNITSSKHRAKVAKEAEEFSSH